MVVLPAFKAVTLPFTSTIATLSSFETQATFLFVASSGVMTTCKLSLCPSVSERVLLFNATSVTGISGSTAPSPQVTVHVATSAPSSVITTTTTVPVAKAVTSPFAFTVATLVSLDFQVTFLFVALSGVTVAIKLSLPPISNTRAVLFNDTPVTGTTSGSISSSTHAISNAERQIHKKK